MESIKEIVNNELTSAFEQQSTENKVEEIKCNKVLCEKQKSERPHLSSNYK